jgi:hypothetical protein
MNLYYHKTDGGAEYLTDKFVICPNGQKEGVFEGAEYIVRIDGDITKDAELTVTSSNELLLALRDLTAIVNGCRISKKQKERYLNNARAAIAKAEGK